MNRSEIIFPNGNRAILVTPPKGTSAVEILRVLDIPRPQALILVFGGASGLDETLTPLLLQLCSRGIARLAADMEALIMDGGTQSGVMAVIGQGVAERGRHSLLLGVAPAGKVTYPGGLPVTAGDDRVPLDPNHSHFVLVESREWGDETTTLYSLAQSLAEGISAVTILVNGGPIAKEEVLESVRHNWPIVVIEGTGRLADEIARLTRTKGAPIEDPVVAEIIAHGDIRLFPLKDPVDNLERLLSQLLHAASNPDLAR